MKKRWMGLVVMVMMIGCYGCTTNDDAAMVEPSPVDTNEYMVFTDVMDELEQRMVQPDGFHVAVNRPGSNQTIFVNYRQRHDSDGTTNETSDLVNATMVDFNQTIVDMINTSTYYTVTGDDQSTNKIMTINDLIDMDNNMDGITIYDDGITQIIHGQTMLTLQLSSDDLDELTTYLTDTATKYDGQFHWLSSMES